MFWREIKICYGKLSFIKAKRKIDENMNVDIINQMSRKRFDDAVKSITQEYARLEERVKILTEEKHKLQTKINDRFAIDKEIARLNEVIDEQKECLRFGFGVTRQENEVITAWLKKHNLESHGSEYVNRGAIGGGITYSFAPTSIGTVGKIRCSCGEEFCFRDL